MSDTIYRKAAIDALGERPIAWDEWADEFSLGQGYQYDTDKSAIETLPSAQPAQSEMIKEIRKWINSGNRGNADYFIVDKIEEIINKYEQ